LTHWAIAHKYAPVMPAGASLAFALVRVPRGGPRPSEAQFRAALQRDHEQLHLPQPTILPELATAGPYAIIFDGAELDEYVVWER
jgi:hypothetical protein